MKSPDHASARRSFKVRSPRVVLSSLHDDPSIDQRALDVIQTFCPGADDFLARVASYLLDLPSSADPSRSLFASSVSAGLDRVAPLGISPVSLDLHVKGFPLFVRVVSAAFQQLTSLKVTDTRGSTWNPFLDPLGSFATPGASLELTIQAEHPAPMQAHLLRMVVLCRCLSFAHLSSLSDTWQEVSAPC